ncbi:MAG TPA: 1-deoxy-D-xylulose-5-phosphate reductoisomerase [Candidatus Competibacteraceae bacterium]|nr:1-deoxy-D-xylulose-5-phosphate reductoisomerase [Candidatus Competibacteraceae bacterium]
MIGITILGATGSIGINTLDVLSLHPERFTVVALTGYQDVDGLYRQCLRWRPAYAVLVDNAAAQRLSQRLRLDGLNTRVLSGAAALEEVVCLPETDYVMAAIVGAAGLASTLAAVRAGKRVLLANKESLVMAGRIFMDEVRRHGVDLLPIDSEHNALFQCMPANGGGTLAERGATRILLTGSGGPFRETPLAQLPLVTPEQACAHPNWEMGRKISVDSATMMNKGLEVIEACWLFNATLEQIQVVIHPQSVIHSLVEYADGSVLAQLGNPDMRTPIAHALAWPRRMAAGVAALDLVKVGRLDFQAPDYTRFPCLRLALAAMATGGTAPAVLNAANEVAVQAFLERRLRFTDIARVIESTLEKVTPSEPESLSAILASDTQARRIAREWIYQLRN